MDTYKSAANDGFDLLVKQYKTDGVFSGNFWFGGNTLHTCLNYLIAAKETDATAKILLAGFQVYNDGLSNPDWWRDDYGWWGNAFSVALNFRRQLGYAGASYDSLFTNILGAAQFCWQQLSGNWRTKPYSSATDNSAGSASIPGGTFNNAPDSSVPPMSGRNSVTNEGFWILSQNLARLTPTDPRYQKGADAENNWFAQWLALPGKVPGSVGILNPKGLVLERPTGNQTDPTWYWSGDQGLYLQACMMSGQNPQKVALSVIANMTDSRKVLHENMGFINKPTLKGFIADYATGKGIFMRNLADLASANPGDKAYADFIKTNAAAVWLNKASGNQFLFNWNLAPGYEPNILRVNGKSDALCDLIMQAAGQDALNAALLVAAEGAIDFTPAA